MDSTIATLAIDAEQRLPYSYLINYLLQLRVRRDERPEQRFEVGQGFWGAVNDIFFNERS